MRTANLVIGTTALAVTVVAFAGLLSYRKMQIAQRRSPLHIVFSGSASGLHKGGTVSFDGIPAGRIRSIKLESPRRTVALVMLNPGTPIRKDTTVGIEFQGLTGVAEISRGGGAATAPPAPLGKDGIPILTADWSARQSITDALHDLDKVVSDNRVALKNKLRSFEIDTESLKSKGGAVDHVLANVENAATSFSNAVARINRLAPGLADAKADELRQKIGSLRGTADDFRRNSATAMEEARHTLLDISQGANTIDRRFDPHAAAPLRAPRPARKRR
jgi:phospholipid/cholesterol/gamma-HCH transport system substrate-binding protein